MKLSELLHAALKQLSGLLFAGNLTSEIGVLMLQAKGIIRRHLVVGDVIPSSSHATISRGTQLSFKRQPQAEPPIRDNEFSFRSEMGWRRWQTLCAALLASLMLAWPAAVWAAEVLQVREPDLLLIGDHNRTYSVRLACIAPVAGEETAALKLLRTKLPRRQRVNLMPMGSRDGLLLARVRPLGQEQDLNDLLITAGLAEATESCQP